MKTLLRRPYELAVFLILMLTSNAVKAQELIPCDDGTYADPAVGCVSLSGGSSVNAETSIGSILGTLSSLVTGLVIIAAIAGMMWGGLLYTRAMGDEARLKKAKTAILLSVIGLVVALAARFGVQLIAGVAG